METNEILDLKFKSDDLHKEITIREFFYKLMELLWIEQEGFDGKRPFGNSSWDHDLIKCLVVNKLVKGKVDEDGYLEDFDYDKVNKFVIKQILKPLFGI